MINLLLKIAMFVIGGLFYIHGETSDGWASKMGKCNPWWKYTMGIPIGLLGCALLHSWLPLWSILPYFLASWALPYGEKSPLVKWFGKSGACACHGAGLGGATLFIIGWWAILASVIGGISFYMIHEFDDEGKIKEPKVAVARSISALWTLLFA